MKAKASFVLMISAVIGCGSEFMDPQSAYIPGFNPPVPNTDEMVVVSPIIKDLQPGTNVTMCSYLDMTIAAQTDVTAFRAFQALSGHHVLLTTARQKRPVGTHVCNTDDMVNMGTFLGGGGAENASNFKGVPAGLGFRIPADSQLMLQSHWINASQSPVQGQAVIYVKSQPASTAIIPADQFLADTEDWEIAPHQAAETTTTCQLKQDMQFFMYAGHMHQWGKHITIEHLGSDGSAKTIYSQDWLPEYETNPPEMAFTKDQPYRMHTGDSVRVHCQWQNDTPKTIRFPDDMCYFVGYYFPSQGTMDCSEGVWPTGSL